MRLDDSMLSFRQNLLMLEPGDPPLSFDVSKLHSACAMAYRYAKKLGWQVAVSSGRPKGITKGIPGRVCVERLA